MRRRLSRPLSTLELRILGALLEKEQTTPDHYPLTVNALVAACNQKTNRDPVMKLSAEVVAEALEGLLRATLVWREEGARVERWKHKLDRWLGLDDATKAVVTELLLRGPQTPGALRARCGRMHPFADLVEVEEALARMAAGEEPIVTELGRAPGQKESRWGHLLGEDRGETTEPVLTASAVPAGSGSLTDRLAAVEARLASLEEALAELREARQEE